LRERNSSRIERARSSSCKPASLESERAKRARTQRDGRIGGELRGQEIELAAHARLEGRVIGLPGLLEQLEELRHWVAVGFVVALAERAVESVDRAGPLASPPQDLAALAPGRAALGLEAEAAVERRQRRVEVALLLGDARLDHPILGAGGRVIAERLAALLVQAQEPRMVGLAHLLEMACSITSQPGAKVGQVATSARADCSLERVSWNQAWPRAAR
jgi:hypothetical protein